MNDLQFVRIITSATHAYVRLYGLTHDGAVYVWDDVRRNWVPLPMQRSA